MSREFGGNGGYGGFFHDKIRNAKEDLEGEASFELHKEFIPLLESLYEIAYAISSVEAGDSCIDRTISTTLQELPKMKKWVAKMEESLRPYQDVAEAAVRDYIESEKSVNKDE